PVRMIRKVERLEAELQLVALGEEKILVHGEVEADDAGRSERASAYVAKLSGQVERKRLGIEEALRILLTARERRVLPGRVRPIEQPAGIRCVQAIGYRDGKTGLQEQNRAQLPAAHQCIAYRVPDVEPATLTHRQVPESV